MKHIETGTAAPATTPASVGRHFIDTVNKKAYMSVGTSASTDWKDTTGGGGGSVPSGTGFAHITLGAQDAAAKIVDLASGDVTGTLPVAKGGTGVTTSTGSGNVVLSISPTLVTPALGTPSSGSLANCTGLPASTGITGLAAIATTGSGADLSADSVTYAKMQNVSATNRLLGRITAGAGDLEELTGTQATSLLDVFTSALKGITPASGGGTVNFLRADGTWSQPSGATTVISLTPGATVATDCSLGNVFRLTANQNFTLSNPTNPVDGTRYVWEITQDATGSRIMTLGSNFAFGTDITGADLTTTPSVSDTLTAMYHSPSGKFRIVGFVRGF